MRSIRRQQKDIDKIRKRLFGWAMHSQEGINGISHHVNELVDSVQRLSGAPRSDVQAALAHEPLNTVTEIFAMFNWLTGGKDKEQSATPLARYMMDRTRHESSLGRRWLKQLAKSRFEMREVLEVTPEHSLRLAASHVSGSPVTVHEPRLANQHTHGLILFARVLPMPAGAVLADGLLMLERRVVATLPPDATATDVFAAWATDALITEGYLPTQAQPPLHQSPDSRSASDAAVEPPGPRSTSSGTDESRPDKPAGPSPASSQPTMDTEAREKLLARVRKLFAMAQETEASPHEAEIALRRCQSLMTRFGITEKDLETSEFGRQCAHSGKRVPMHIKFLSAAVAQLHGVLFVTGGAEAEFRGYDIDVRVARLTLDYLSNAVERALTARRRTGDFPPGRMAAYDYRLAFAIEVVERVKTIVREREAEEQASSSTGTSLTVRKLEIVQRECGKNLRTAKVSGRGAINDEAASAGREDGARVSLDPQVSRRGGTRLLPGGK